MFLPDFLHSPVASLSLRRCVRGDVSLLYVFVTLTILLLGAGVLGGITTSNVRRALDIGVSAQAFYAADTGAERGIDVYNWSLMDYLANPTTTFPVCLNTTDSLPGGVATYRVDVHGAGQTTPGSPPCATPENIANGSAALCIEAVGNSGIGSIQRRVVNDSATSSFTGSCR